MQKASTWKTLPLQQTSDDTLWELTRNWNCYLVGDHHTQFSRDPLNLTGLNTKRDSGLANTHALGINYEITERRVREKKAKKKARVVRFTLNIKTRRQLPKRRCVALPENQVPLHNNTVFSSRRRITARAIVKTLRRDLQNYRRDLLPLAFRRLRRLHRFKKANKAQNRAEAKKAKL